MKYYYEGCPSWKWFYPFHYAPFASDLKNIERFRRDCSNFEMGEPFKPIEQLMAVFPQDSSHAIPKASRWLMSDPESPIIDFYPKEIACDPNGKAMPWLWVVLLPFIDEDRLLAALKPTEKDWSEYDRLCNSRGLDDGYIYCHISHSLASALTPVIDTLEPHSKMHIDGCDIFGALRQPLSNELYPLDKRSVIQPPKTSYKIKSENVDELLTSPVDPNAALCAAFTEPPKGVHMSIILRGAQPPKPVLRSDDLHIRRPRLNRGGGTIANLGAGRSSGQSHQAGYGSMNISSYERSLAERSGRGHQMNQAGTRAWGAMEPTAKRPRGVSNHHSYSQSTSQYQPTLFQQPFQHGNHRGGHAQSSYPNTGTFQQRGSTNTGNRGLASRWQPPGQQQQQQQQQPPPHFSPQPMWAPALHRQPVPSHPPPPPHQQQQQSSRNGYNFQQFSTTRNHTSHHHHQQQQHQGQHQRPGQGSSRSGVSTNVMNNLRSQLKSTLHRNKKTQN
jgi:5'-3' exoribonuclease 2